MKFTKMTSKLKELNIEILSIYLSLKIIGKAIISEEKPNPGMFFEASSKHLFRLDKTFYIGDDLRDCEAAFNANCNGLIISDKVIIKIYMRLSRFTDLEKMVPYILKKYNLHLNKHKLN